MTKVTKYYEPLDNAHYETYELEFTLDSIAAAISFINSVPGKSPVRGFDGGVVWYNSDGTRMVCNTGYVIYKSSKDKNQDFFIEYKKFFEEMIEVTD